MEKLKAVLLAGILICLFFIAQKPVPNFSYTASSPSSPTLQGYDVIQLAPNRVAVMDNRPNSGTMGTVLVFQFNEAKQSFDFIGQYNYSDFFNNPQNHGIQVNQ